ncbi:MAG TPA: hypothetical protein VEP46_17340 [Vicinamibacterales bacterium]|nr:hypothetical protein [Vicinamibacterales bacterium]
MRTRFGVSALAVGIIVTLCVVSFAVIAGQVSSPGPAAAPPSVPAASAPIGRQANGKPDFSGIWQANNTANWDLVTHEAMPARVMQAGVHQLSSVPAAPLLALGAVGGVPPGVGVVEGGVIPYKPEALQKKKDNFEHWLDRDPEIKCYQPGVPRAMYMPYPFQILHGANKIMMVFEYANAQRTIHLDQVEPYPNEAWMGHSVGKWDGDTLVVDVTSQIDKTWFDRAGDFHSDALHVVERYRMMSHDAIWYEATVEDPNVFTRPWKMAMPLYRRLEPNAQLMDYRCIEMVEELLYGHLRKQPLVRTWEGQTMTVRVERKVPPPDVLYER